MNTALEEIEIKFYDSLKKVKNREIETYDLTEILLDLRDTDEDLYQRFLKKVPASLLAEIIVEMPDHLQEELSEFIGTNKLAQAALQMDTDDAADLIQNIGEGDEQKAEDILEKLDDENRETIEKLISYDEDVAGAHMQTEIFSAVIDEPIEKSIARLRTLKRNKQLDHVYHVFITNNQNEYICSLGLEEVIIHESNETYECFLKNYVENLKKISANHYDNIERVVEKVSDYNLPVIPIVDDHNKLIGRITSDDIYDLIEDMATEDIYNMAGVSAEAEETNEILPVIKTRVFWLFINLLTAIAASYVISIFDSTIQAYVALAVLMPIIASMGGNAGTQTLTVTVRQLATGDIDKSDAFETIKKEITLALINGLLFSVTIGGLAYLWFKLPKLGYVIALATIINLFVAGLFGSVIPLILEKLKIDPAIASTVLLTTITDIVGFLTFLGLANLIMF